MSESWTNFSDHNYGTSASQTGNGRLINVISEWVAQNESTTRKSTRRVNRICNAKGCQIRTSHSKPFCTKHLLDMPYASTIAEALAKREKETQRVLEKASNNQKYSIHKDSPILSDILIFLSREFGDVAGISMHRLSKMLWLSYKVTVHYVEFLKRKGKVVTFKDGKATMVRLKGEWDKKANVKASKVDVKVSVPKAPKAPKAPKSVMKQSA